MRQDPYLPEPRLDRQRRLVVWKVLLALGISTGLLLGAAWWWLQHRYQGQVTIRPPAPLTTQEIEQPLPVQVPAQTTYAQVTPILFAPPPDPAPPSPTPGPPVPPLAHGGDRAPTSPPPVAPRPRQGSLPPSQPRPAPSQAPQGTPPPKAAWMQPKVVVLASPFAKGPLPGTQGAGGPPGGTAHGSGLIQATPVEHPEDPTTVLYRDQVITGMLMDHLSSDTPGQVRVKVTAPVYDRLGQRTILIPQHSVIMAVQTDKAVFGQQRIPMRDLVVLFPDGGVVALKDSQVADRAGAAGVPADVNNHYGKLLLAAGISALLNVGAQAGVGNTSNYQPTYQQDVVRDLGRSVQQTGEKVVNKQLEVPPTLEAKAGDPVTIQLMQNYRFVK